MRIGPGAARRVLALSWTERGRLAGAFVCMTALAASSALYALLLGPMLEALFRPDQPPGRIAQVLSLWGEGAVPAALPRWLLPAAILLVAAVRGLAFWGQRHAMSSASERIVGRLRARAFEALVEAELLASRGLRVGDVAARLTRDADQVREAVSDGVASLGRDLLSAIFLFGVAVSLDGELSVIAFVAFPLTALALTWFGRRLRRAHAGSDALRGNLGARVGEVFLNLEAVKADAGERQERATFEEAVDRLAALETRASSLRAAHHGVVEFVGVGGLALTLVWAIGRIASGELSADTFVSFFAALMLLYEPLKGLSRANAMFQAGASGLARIEALTALPSERTGGRAVGPFESLRFEGVSLTFDDGTVALTDLELSLRRGDVLAVVGPSGAGKTTLGRLCLGLLAPTRGRVLVDGVDLRDLDLRALRAQIAWAGQDVLLFDASLRDNLRRARPEATEAELDAAASLAGVTPFAAELADGWETRLGERGLRLSGGQRQRLALGRALLKEASLLILDEALTGVEADLRQELLRGILAARTPTSIVILITHDPTLAAMATRTLTLAPVAPPPPLP